MDDEGVSQRIIPLVLNINHSVGVSVNFFLLPTFPLRHNMTARVLCAENFQGSDCTECVLGFTGHCVMSVLTPILREACNGNG